MTNSTKSTTTNSADFQAVRAQSVDRLQQLGIHLSRFGLVIVFIWIGGMKFTSYEAEGIRPFVENSPIMSWLYQWLSVQQFSAILGVVEILIGLLIAMRFQFPKLSALGSLSGALMFGGTLSFIVTTPGWEESLGFPALSVTGQFLLKDSVLLGVSVWTAAEAWQATFAEAEANNSGSQREVQAPCITNDRTNSGS